VGHAPQKLELEQPELPHPFGSAEAASLPGMTRQARLRCSSLVAALAVLVIFGGGLGNGRAPDQSPVSRSSAVTAGVMGLQPPALLDNRLPRAPEIGRRQSPSDHDGSVSGAPGQLRLTGTRALIAIPEHSDLPGRKGQIFLRGPPGSSA